MKVTTLPLEQTGTFAPLFTDYMKGVADLHPYYRATPDLEGLKEVISNFNFPAERRSVLRKAFQQQYEGFDLGDAVNANINKLEEDDCYTITTGHQLCLFTGPLYFIYKIVTTINLAKKLQQEYPDKSFVPVYWMATEDHDFDEINHFFLFNKKFEWEKETTGAVGYLPTDDLKTLFDGLNEELPQFRKAYLESKNLAEATRKIVHNFFKNEGLLIIDPDDVDLKKEFSPIIEDELLDQTTNDLVLEQSQRLSSLGYKPQIFPREINFFYMSGDIRERIIEENGRFEVQHTSFGFSKEEITVLANESPELFSPNVVMRPVFQQHIMPNIAYIGGPSEVCYWLQLKPVFDNYQVEFPVLLPRNFALVIPKTVQDKIDKLELSDADLFLDIIDLKKKFLSEDDDKPSLKDQKKQINEIFHAIMQQAEELDPSLKGYIGAEESKIFKSLGNIEKRLEKVHENRFDIQVKQLESVKDKLFPDGKLQERRDNFLNFHINNPLFIKELLQELDPLSKDFYLIHND